MTRHKFSTTHIFPITGTKRESCMICGALRWSYADGIVQQWQPECWKKYYRDCDALPEPVEPAKSELQP